MKIREFIKNFYKKLINLIYPNDIKCMFCNDELKPSSYNHTCENCFDTLPFIKNFCDRCGSMVKPDLIGVCQTCKTTNYNFINARSVFVYNEITIPIVHNIKYNSKKYLIPFAIKYMVDYFSTMNLFPDIITNIPMHEKKVKARGYNQSKLLAQEFSKSTNIPFIEFCSKIIDNNSQTKLSFDERKQNVKDVFKFKSEHRKSIKGKTILIIDDVITTGATASELSKVLTKNGAKECYVLTFAHSQVEKS